MDTMRNKFNYDWEKHLSHFFYLFHISFCYNAISSLFSLGKIIFSSRVISSFFHLIHLWFQLLKFTYIWFLSLVFCLPKIKWKMTSNAHISYSPQKSVIFPFYYNNLRIHVATFIDFQASDNFQIALFKNFWGNISHKKICGKFKINFFYYIFYYI